MNTKPPETLLSHYILASRAPLEYIADWIGTISLLHNVEGGRPCMLRYAQHGLLIIFAQPRSHISFKQFNITN